MRSIMVSVGEASGDLHGAALAAALWQLEPDLRIFGVGGQAMRSAGVEIVYDIAELGVVGLVEVLRNLPRLFKVKALLTTLMERERPDVLVVIDYPGFNTRLAKEAKAKGIPVVYYIAPKVWAWGRGRAKTIAAAADKVAAIFPFEVPLYREAGADVDFVGHPLLDLACPQLSRQEAFAYFGADPERPVVLLMPGSRRQEITGLLPVFLAAAEKIQKARPECQFFLPLASTISPEMVQNRISRCAVSVTLTRDRTYDLMSISRVAVAASGTATLETALLGVPTVIAYKMSAVTALIARRLIRVPWVGLPNIVAGRSILPELLQEDANPAMIAAAALQLLQEGPERNAALAAMARLREDLGGSGVLERVARTVLATAGGRALRK
ncbi:MAG TPA: lipid-A-disaccharide synthase [Patescibacteria group bacterium]|nr:lipid-A-disaccharide synthase [Patescibacteria group bacterium]